MLIDKRTAAYLFLALLLTAVGILEISSVSPRFLGKQVSWMLLGIFAFFILRALPLKTLRAVSPLLYLIGLVLLVLVLFLGKGLARRWIDLGPFYLQPSELMKLIMIVLLPKMFESGKSVRASFLKTGLLSSLPFFLVLTEPDLGTSAFFLFIWVYVAFVARTPPTPLLSVVTPILAGITSFSKVLFAFFLSSLFLSARLARLKLTSIIMILTLALAVGFSTPLIWQKGLKPYQRERIVAFIDSGKHLRGAAWQTLQAKVALGAGGFGGTGYKKGTQIRFSFLPAAHTDFIFSSLGEEFGLIGTLGVLLLFLLLLDLLLQHAKRSRDPYKRLLGMGIMGYFLYHTVLNVASNLGFFPVVGIPLPFLTAGGSHLIVDFSLLGLWSRALWEDRIEGLRFKGLDFF